VICFQLQLPVRLNHLGMAMSASRMQVPLAHHGGRRRLKPEGCILVDVVPHPDPPFNPSEASSRLLPKAGCPTRRVASSR
jgi:hypothetical protein